MAQQTETNETGGAWSYSELESLQATLYRYCLSITASRQEAEDLVQDTWVKALGTLQGPGHRNAEAFLLRIARNVWIDRMRREKLKSRLIRLEQPAAVTLEDTLETERMLGALVRHMSPLQRTVFLLRDVFGFTAAETAKRLGTTEGAVKAALFRARTALAAIREEWSQQASSSPEDEGLRIYLRNMAAAYQDGEVAKLAALAQQDILQPMTALTLARARCHAKPRNLTEHPVRMAASYCTRAA